MADNGVPPPDGQEQPKPDIKPDTVHINLKVKAQVYLKIVFTLRLKLYVQTLSGSSMISTFEHHRVLRRRMATCGPTAFSLLVDSIRGLYSGSLS